MPDRCRLCTTNDREALIEELASRLYECRREGVLPPWERAGDYWQRVMRNLALETVNMLHPHG